ncbi:hypothetical protein [Streptomyces bohaiensis]|uniref:Uncharacterized protein n=1 Tax=Streptomyces bohaiensis TaxID=1431344 RepID=A0ABX1CCS5_9ACTN|nr:hypothetical protein [Streptomyces bohaiensis]NJQ16904.1 hypothetical protein [Streptomyces bohaiensis]
MTHAMRRAEERRQPVDGYWCETVARGPDAGRDWYLGGFWAASPDAAVDWLRRQGLRMATALAPHPGRDRPVGAAVAAAVASEVNPGQVFRDWAEDAAFHEVQRKALRDGHPISANARDTERVRGLGEVEVLYSLSARPVRLHAAPPPAAGPECVPERSTAGSPPPQHHRCRCRCG